MFVSAVAILVLAAPAHAPVSDELRNAFDLYKKLDLPVSPKGSALVATAHGEATSEDGQRWTTYKVGFLAPVGTDQRLLVGTRWEPKPALEKKLIELRFTDELPEVSWFGIPNQLFHTYVHIALAMQALALGEESFAARMAQASIDRRAYLPNTRTASFIGYRADESLSSAVAMLAVSHWANRLVEPGFDRMVVLAKLREIDKTGLISHKDKWGWGFLQLIGHLEAHGSIRFPQIKGNGIVEGLLECAGYEGFKNRDPAYKKVLELGLDSVPALLNHWDDPRLTRAWDFEDMALPRRVFQMKHLVRWAIHDISEGSLGPVGNFVYGGKKEDAETWYRKVKRPSAGM